MANTWIVVAESSRAKVFTGKGRQAGLELLETFEHPEARQHERDLASDRPGRAFDSAGQGRHAMEQDIGPKEQETIRFAKQIAGYLEAARVKGGFNRLILVAAPRFLGELRQQLSANTTALVTDEIGKNLVQQEPEDIRKHLPERL